MNDLISAQAASKLAEPTALASANKTLLDALAAQAASQLALDNARNVLKSPCDRRPSAVRVYPAAETAARSPSR